MTLQKTLEQNIDKEMNYREIPCYNEIKVAYWLLYNYSNMNKKRMDYLEKLSVESKINSFLAWKLLKYVSYKEYDLDIDQLVLNYNEYGKPFFDEFEFSISHSDQYIAVGISKSKNFHLKCTLHNLYRKIRQSLNFLYLYI